MLSWNNLDSLVTYRRPILEKLSLESPQDVKQFPTIILLGQYIAESSISDEDLINLLQAPSRLEEELEIYTTNRRERPNITLTLSIGPDSPLHEVAAAVRTSSDFFAFGFEAKFPYFLVGKTTPATFRFPSGREVEYNRIISERTAGVSLFDVACSLSYPDEMYVRDVSVRGISAMFKAWRKEGKLRNYEGQFEEFPHVMNGIILAHELSELQMHREGDIPETGIEIEFEAERRSRKILEDNGINLRHWELFHTIRTCEDKKYGPNNSSVLLGHEF
jgi:hypothetical protein